MDPSGDRSQKVLIDEMWREIDKQLQPDQSYERKIQQFLDNSVAGAGDGPAGDFKRRLRESEVFLREDVWDLERCGAISTLLDNYYENSYQISCKDLTILKKLQLKKMRTERLATTPDL